MQPSPTKPHSLLERSVGVISGHTGNRGARTSLPIALASSTEQQRQRAATQAQAIQEQLFAEAKANASDRSQHRPRCYKRPAYNTPKYWRDCTRGWITETEQRNDHVDFEVRRKRAVDSKHNKARAPHRHLRSAPRSTKQFSKQMSTQAARDDRLTPQSKALLQVIVARTGQGRSTDTTKTTLGAIVNRCPRSIQRYIGELVKFGYIRTQTIKSRKTGFYIGMRIWIMNSVLPFFVKQNPSYAPENWLDLLSGRRNRVETGESPTNINNIFKSVLCETKPPWFAEYAFGVERQ